MVYQRFLCNIIISLICYLFFTIPTKATTPDDAFEIVCRNGWHAKPPIQIQVMKNPVPYVIIHHSFIPGECKTREQCIEAMQWMQEFHQNSRLWNDIGYSFAIGGDGMVYEGRGWSAVGAHAPHYNNRSIGICLIGNWEDKLPPKIQLDAAKKLIEIGTQNGYIVDNYVLLGHRQVRDTNCPGDALYKEISTWPHYKSSFKDINVSPITSSSLNSINQINSTHVDVAEQQNVLHNYVSTNNANSEESIINPAKSNYLSGQENKMHHTEELNKQNKFITPNFNSNNGKFYSDEYISGMLNSVQPSKQYLRQEILHFLNNHPSYSEKVQNVQNSEFRNQISSDSNIWPNNFNKKQILAERRIKNYLHNTDSFDTLLTLLLQKNIEQTSDSKLQKLYNNNWKYSSKPVEKFSNYYSGRQYFAQDNTPYVTPKVYLNEHQSQNRNKLFPNHNNNNNNLHKLSLYEAGKDTAQHHSVSGINRLNLNSNVNDRNMLVDELWNTYQYLQNLYYAPTSTKKQYNRYADTNDFLSTRHRKKISLTRIVDELLNEYQNRQNLYYSRALSNKQYNQQANQKVFSQTLNNTNFSHANTHKNKLTIYDFLKLENPTFLQKVECFWNKYKIIDDYLKFHNDESNNSLIVNSQTDIRNDTELKIEKSESIPTPNNSGEIQFKMNSENEQISNNQINNKNNSEVKLQESRSIETASVNNNDQYRQNKTLGNDLVLSTESNVEDINEFTAQSSAHNHSSSINLNINLDKNKFQTYLDHQKQGSLSSSINLNRNVDKNKFQTYLDHQKQASLSSSINLNRNVDKNKFQTYLDHQKQASLPSSINFNRNLDEIKFRTYLDHQKQASLSSSINLNRNVDKNKFQTYLDYQKQASLSSSINLNRNVDKNSFQTYLDHQKQASLSPSINLNRNVGKNNFQTYLDHQKQVNLPSSINFNRNLDDRFRTYLDHQKQASLSSSINLNRYPNENKFQTYFNPKKQARFLEHINNNNQRNFYAFNHPLNDHSEIISNEINSIHQSEPNKIISIHQSEPLFHNVPITSHHNLQTSLAQNNVDRHYNSLNNLQNNMNHHRELLNSHQNKQPILKENLQNNASQFNNNIASMHQTSLQQRLKTINDKHKNYANIHNQLTKSVQEHSPNNLQTTSNNNLQIPLEQMNKPTDSSLSNQKITHQIPQTVVQ